jgi:hypothetical protein
MPDPRGISTGKTMRAVKLLSICFVSCILLGSSCPSPVPFPPPPLSAPVFTAAELVAAKFDTYRPAVHLAWKPPHTDSLSIREFVILQKSLDSSNFSVLVRSIPDTITVYDDNLDRSAFPQAWDITTMQYRIFAIDTLGRSGDTSDIDSVAIAWPPIPQWPPDRDTVLPDTLVWSVFGVMNGYFTYVSLYADSAGLVWKSPKPDTPTYSNHDKTDHIIVPVPKSVPLVSGATYFWAVKVEIPSGSSSSMAISRFYVP